MRVRVRVGVCARARLGCDLSSPLVASLTELGCARSLFLFPATILPALQRTPPSLLKRLALRVCLRLAPVVAAEGKAKTCAHVFVRVCLLCACVFVGAWVRASVRVCLATGLPAVGPPPGPGGGGALQGAARHDRQGTPGNLCLLSLEPRAAIAASARAACDRRGADYALAYPITTALASPFRVSSEPF